MEAKNKKCSQMATSKDNKFREDLCSNMECHNKESLLIKSFKHGNYAFMEKIITFYRMTYMKHIALTGEITVYPVFC